MKRKGVGLFCAGKQLAHSFLLLVALATALTGALQAQTIATTTTQVIAPQGGYGILQAGDGNFYATSGPSVQTCNHDTAHLCAYIFKVTSDGTASIFHAFQPTATAVTPNLDGIKPTSLFVGADGNLYGTCQLSGPGGAGTIFEINLLGKSAGDAIVLKSFISTDPGAGPIAMIQAADGSFYWTNGLGIYQLANDGSMSTVYEYALSQTTGLYPQGNLANSLVQGSDGNLYLTQVVAPQTAPGTGKSGAIAQLTLSGQLTILHPFAEDGSEGAVDIASIITPGGQLVQASDGAFYGVTKFSGPNQGQGPGMAYQVTPGGGFTILHKFNGTDEGNYTNAALILGSDGNLYGTTQLGGDTGSDNCTPFGCGTFYQMKRSGTLTTLHKFEGGLATSTVVADNPQVDGERIAGTLVQTGGGFFYGTTLGGTTGDPTVFKSSLTPPALSPVQLTVNPTTVLAGNPVQLSWQVRNAFSKTAQLCTATVATNSAHAGDWSGPQAGALNGGIFSGGTIITPTAAGLYIYALTCGGNESGFVSLLVTGNTPLQMQTTALPQATVSQAYQVFLSVTGGISPYQWTVAGALPKGLTFDQSGLLSGTPLQFGDYPLTFGVQDSTTPDPQTSGTSLTLHVDSGLTLFPTIQNPIANKDYSQSLNASGGLPPYTFQLTGGALPPGLTFNATAGSISGTPTQDGPYSFTIKLSDSENPKATVTQTYSIVVGAAGLQITSPDFLPNPSVGVPYSTSLTATGGMPPYFWSYGVNTGSPFLQEPEGLTLSTGGLLSGTPIQYNFPGKYDNFNVVVTDSEDPPVKVTRTLALSVQSTLQMLTTGLPIGQVGTITETPLMATGGIPPYTWRAQTTGVDPNTIGVYLNDGNVIVENPLQPVNTTAVIYLQDSEKQSDNKQITVPLIFLPAAFPTTTTLSSSNTAAGTGESVTFTAKVVQTSGVPAGTVVFFSGGNTMIGNAILDANGSASIQTSFATAGVYNITAVFGGSTNSAGSTSTPLSETVVTPSITTSVNPGTLTIKSGSSGTLTITLTPAGDFTGTVNFSCGTLPAHVSCSFVPPSIAIVAGSGPVTDTLTVHTDAPQAAMLKLPSSVPHSNTSTAAILWLPGSLLGMLVLIPRKRTWARAGKSKIVLVLSLFCVAALVSCGGGPSNPPSTNDASHGTYIIPITLSIGGGGTQNVNATITVD